MAHNTAVDGFRLVEPDDLGRNRPFMLERVRKEGKYWRFWGTYTSESRFGGVKIVSRVYGSPQINHVFSRLLPMYPVYFSDVTVTWEKGGTRLYDGGFMVLWPHTEEAIRAQITREDDSRPYRELYAAPPPQEEPYVYTGLLYDAKGRIYHPVY